MFWRMTKRVSKFMMNKRHFSKLENKAGRCIGILTTTYIASASITGIGSGIWAAGTIFQDAIDVDIYWTLRPLLYAAFIPYCLLQGFIVGCLSGVFCPFTLPFFLHELTKKQK